tara:strand:+ start:101 stop:877 length:777 start_codon:yes stop_codon:yes gene_type:complete
MKFALVDNQKTKATKGAKGFCPSCGSELIAKCGEVKLHHWAHKGVRNCDPWWENETQWHRSWKSHFSKEWQEVVHKADNGEKHIADVKTEHGWVLEFQHSYLNPEERRSRDAFYPKLVWVVDGLRRKRDKKQFQNILEDSTVIHSQPVIRKVNWPKECRILTEWLTSPNLVFFDFQESNLWFLLPIPSSSEAFIMTIFRKDFIEYQINERFEKLIVEQINPICEQLVRLKNQQRKKRNIITLRKGISNRELRRRNRRF